MSRNLEDFRVLKSDQQKSQNFVLAELQKNFSIRKLI